MYHVKLSNDLEIMVAPSDQDGTLIAIDILAPNGDGFHLPLKRKQAIELGHALIAAA
jgi:hypothetical protein